MIIKLFLLEVFYLVRKLLLLVHFRVPKYEEADMVEILEKSPDRIDPKCQVYGVCGGCSFQHLSAENQINC